MNQRLVACLFASLLAVPSLTLPVLAAPDSQIQHYQRKYISFYYPQNYPLNRALSSAFERGFPRFDYHLISTSLQMDFSEFLEQTRAYQEKVAGDIAAGKEVKDPHFGDKVVSWSETQQIAKSAYVFVPVWQMSDISAEGPYAKNTSHPLNDSWKINAQNTTRMKMELWNLAGAQAKRINTISDSWTVTRDEALTVSASAVMEAAQRYNRTVESDEKIDLSKSLSSTQRAGLLAQLREDDEINDAIEELEDEDPYTYMMPTAVKSIGYGGVIGSVQRMSEFLIRAEIDNPDMRHDRVGIQLGEGETAKSLGIGLDSGYKIVEYVKGSKDPREVGYVKIREINKAALISQPIIVGRDFELGDQVVEYPKAGIGFNLRGGATLDSSLKNLGGGGGVDLDFNIGPALGMSELYFDLSGGYYNNLWLVEGGLQKKWFWRQLIFALGVRGGASFGEKTVGGRKIDDNGFGLTGLAGLHWQASPDFVFGVDGGWRQYSNLSGPLLEGFVRFEL